MNYFYQIVTAVTLVYGKYFDILALPELFIEFDFFLTTVVTL